MDGMKCYLETHTHTHIYIYIYSQETHNLQNHMQKICLNVTHFHETRRKSQFMKSSIWRLKWENPLLLTFDIFALTVRKTINKYIV